MTGGRPLAVPVALVLVAILFGVGPCQGAGAIGWIEEFTGSPEQYQLIRRSERVPVRLFMGLEAGDDVSVLRPEGRVRLWLGDGRSVELRGQGHAREVLLGLRTVPTVATNVMDWATRWFTESHQESATRTVSVHVRGSKDALSAALLERRETPVAVSRQPLFLAWEGGLAPYNVLLRRFDDGAVMTSVDRLTYNRVRIDRGLDSPGRYEVTIGDSQGRSLRARLIAVPSQQVPVAPGELRRDTLQGPARRTLAAAWLSGREEGRWAFEAYQEVMMIGDEYRPAILLREQLERGEGPTGAPD